jgi:nuclear transcription factor Y gamma
MTNNILVDRLVRIFVFSFSFGWLVGWVCDLQAANEFKNHQLPLARIKRIVKADEDVRMISAEAPVLFAKACEMFILELTLRSWIHAEENKRRTLQKTDITAAITRTDIFDFLVDIVPQDELSKEDGLAAATAGMIPRGIMPVANPPVVYYLHQQQPLAGLQQEAPAATILSQQQQQQEEANMTLSSALLLARPTEMVMDPTLDQQQQQPFVIPQKPMQQMWQQQQQQQQHMLPNSQLSMQ